jgi:uncharacterized protein with ParB-like and HNH nuclease domain
MKNPDTLLISSIAAEKLAIKDVFSDNYLFTIPNYQRPYSWEEDHCVQLIDDIQNFAFKDYDFNNLPPYFLGSAVIIKKTESRNAQIVDGQQRLVSLTIILSCLRYCIDDEGNKATISSLIFQKGDELLGTSATYRLKTRFRDQEFFKKLIQETDGLKNYLSETLGYVTTNDAQRQFIANAKAILKYFENKEYTQDKLKILAKYIIQKCVIVVVASTDEDMAFRIFNVLNDRGKDLTISDILKSELLEKINAEDQDCYTFKWEECEVKLSTENFKDFFSHLRAIYSKKKAEEKTLNEIRSFATSQQDPKLFIDNILIPYSNAYNDVLRNEYKSSSHSEDINCLFIKLKRVQHTDWIPPTILFLAKYYSDPESVSRFLFQLERLTLGMESMRATLNERIERYAKIISKIENNLDLYKFESEFLLSDKDRESIIKSLNSEDLYGKRLLKPVLAKIEEQMNDCSITINYQNLSIEHILPQSPNGDYWTSKFNSNDLIKLTDCIGNLTLISVRKNYLAQNFDFHKKINVYFKADGMASNLSMINRLSAIDDWTPIQIKNRKVVQINYFLKALGLKEITD